MRLPIPLGLPLLLAAAHAAAAPPLIDGSFDDWTDAPVVAEFAPLPAAATPRLLRVRALATAQRFLFLLELDREAAADDLDVEFLFDADADSTTGRPVDGLGADLTWSLGKREGTVWVWGLPVRVEQGTLGLRRAPTVSSDRFEISFARTATAAGAPIFEGGEVRAVVADRARGTSGVSPVVRFEVPALLPPEPPAPPADLARRDPTHVRVLSYNVLFDGLFKRTDRFRRILRAIDPDVIVFQEIFDHTPEQTAALLRELLPEAEWSFAGARGGVLVSRLRLDDSGPTGGSRGGFWVRLAPVGLTWPSGLVILTPHPPCCENAAGRRNEIDAAVAWWRDEREAGRVPADTPLIIAGDMNLVGAASELGTLLTGAIADTVAWGAPSAPDADGTPLADAEPLHTTGRESYTWRSDEGPFAPGRLDFILYSDAVLALGNRFVLWTPDMAAGELQAAGLERDDTALASDHLPVVADFAPRGRVEAPAR